MTTETMATLRRVDGLLIAVLLGALAGCGPSQGEPSRSTIPMGPSGPTGPADHCGDGKLGALDTRGCSPLCMPDCSGRSCGPDPVCGMSCGTCAHGLCDPAGACPEEPARLPTVVSFTTTSSVYRGVGALIFTASVADPNQDLVGGVLATPSGQSYGDFSVLAEQPGTYSIGVDLAGLQAGEPLFSGPEGVRRWFTAEFFDAEGNRARSPTLDLVVRCPQDGRSFCDGDCLSLAEDVNNCGRCGRRCDSLTFSEPLAWDGRCFSNGCMVPVREAPPVARSCASACARQHIFCVPSPEPGSPLPMAGEASYSCGITQPLASCDDPVPELAPGGGPDCTLQTLRCSCGK